MNKSYLVYLAGPITDLPYKEAVAWREQVAAMLPGNIIALSPMRGKEWLSRKKKLSKVGYKDHVLSTSRGIITRDRFDTTRCDVLFVNFLGADKASIGTVMEIAWADLCRKPIVIVMEPNNIHRHAMLSEAAGYVVSTLEEGVEMLISILGVQNGQEETLDTES